MPINSDKPHLWKQDIAASVDQFNKWFMKFAPKAYRDTRVQTTKDVERTLGITNDFAALTADVLKEHPGILPTLRMSLCPPIARDRLVGLAYATKNLMYTMEEGTIPPRINPDELQKQLARRLPNEPRESERGYSPYYLDPPIVLSRRWKCHRVSR